MSIARSAALCASFLLVSAGLLFAQDLTLVSETAEDDPALDFPDAGMGSEDPSISAGGRYIVFESHFRLGELAAEEGTVGDPPTQQVYLSDRLNQAISLISESADGEPGTGESGDPAVSPDGRWVAFETVAPNLIPDLEDEGVGFVVQQIMLRHCEDPPLCDPEDTTLVSVGFDGLPANGTCSNPAVSLNGRWVAFDSDATNLVDLPGASAEGGAKQLYLYDLVEDELRMISVDADGNPGLSDSRSPSISADGRFVSFTSRADNLLDGELDEGEIPDQVLLYDRLEASISLVSENLDGEPADDNSDSSSISLDGEWVAFESRASDLVELPGSDHLQVFLRNLESGENIAVSRSLAGGFADDDSSAPQVSGNGRYVAYHGEADDITPSAEGDGHAYEQVFLYERLSDMNLMISVDGDGNPGNHTSRDVALSARASVLVFESSSTDLVPEDPNGAFDDVIEWTRPDVLFQAYGGGSMLASGLQLNMHGQDGASEGSFGIRLEHADAGSIGSLLFATRPADFPLLGGTALLAPPTCFLRTTFALGEPNAAPGGWWILSNQNFSAFVGSTFYLQAAVLDPASATGISFTNGLAMDVLPE